MEITNDDFEKPTTVVECINCTFIFSNEYPYCPECLDNQIPLVPEIFTNESFQGIDNKIKSRLSFLEDYLCGKEKIHLEFDFYSAFTHLVKSALKENMTEDKAELIMSYYNHFEYISNWYYVNGGNQTEIISIIEGIAKISKLTKLMFPVFDLLGDYDCKFDNSRLSPFYEIHSKFENNEEVRKLDIHKEIQGNSTNIIVREIHIKDEYISRIHGSLKEYFPNNENNLLLALQGKSLSHKIFFSQKQNKLSSLFKDLKESQIITSNNKEISRWLSKNFQFLSNNNETKSFSENSCYDVLRGTAKQSRESLFKVDELFK